MLTCGQDQESKSRHIDRQQTSMTMALDDENEDILVQIQEEQRQFPIPVGIVFVLPVFVLKFNVSITQR